MIVADDVLGDILEDPWPSENPSRLGGRASIGHRCHTGIDGWKEAVISQGGMVDIVGRGNVRWQVRSTERHGSFLRRHCFQCLGF